MTGGFRKSSEKIENRGNLATRKIGLLREIITALQVQTRWLVIHDTTLYHANMAFTCGEVTKTWNKKSRRKCNNKPGSNEITRNHYLAFYREYLNRIMANRSKSNHLLEESEIFIRVYELSVYSTRRANFFVNLQRVEVN